jgi:hypothetical protein
VSLTDPTEPPDDPELRARLSARQTERTVGLGTVLLLGLGLLAVAAVVAMLVVSW